MLPELARAVGSSGRVIGVDASPASAALAADRVRRAAMADICRVIAADPPPIPAPDGWADALIISFMLGSVDTARRAGLLDDCRRVLSIGGRMVCVTVSDRDAGSYATRMYGALHRHAPGIAGSEPIAAASLAAAAGFTLTDRLGLRLWRLQVDVIRAVT